MWVIIAQAVTDLQPPKDGNMAAYFAWAMGLLVFFTLGVLAYLVSTSRAKDVIAKEALDRLFKTLEDRTNESENRLDRTWLEHEKDRSAFLHRQDELAQMNRESLQHLRDLREHFKNGGK